MNGMTLIDAIERVYSALDHRIHLSETVMIPRAKEARNHGIVSVLSEGLEKDKEAKRVLKDYLSASGRNPDQLLP